MALQHSEGAAFEAGVSKRWFFVFETYCLLVLDQEPEWDVIFLSNGWKAWPQMRCTVWMMAMYEIWIETCIGYVPIIRPVHKIPMKNTLESCGHDAIGGKLLICNTYSVWSGVVTKMNVIPIRRSNSCTSTAVKHSCCMSGNQVEKSCDLGRGVKYQPQWPSHGNPTTVNSRIRNHHPTVPPH